MINTVNTAEVLRTNIINIGKQETAYYEMPVMSCMAAQDNFTEDLYVRTSEAQDKGSGMSPFPEELFNSMVEHCINHRKIRDAMYLICSANWGTRFSDTVRVRFCHIFDNDGRLKESFTLPYGEKKTGKLNIYYNNEAVARIIGLYLQSNPNKTPYDFLFTSEAYCKTKASLKEIEADELYGYDIHKAEKKVEELKRSLEKSINSFVNNTFTSEQYIEITGTIKIKLAEEEENLKELCDKRDSYISLNPNAEKTIIVKPISAMAAENIIKNTLADMGIFPKNKKKSEMGNTNLDCKLNTHSLRKTFGELFYRKGCELRESGELTIDSSMLNLLQQKFMHASIGTTNRYNSFSEQSFKVICTRMNTGLEAIKSSSVMMKNMVDKYN